MSKKDIWANSYKLRSVLELVHRHRPQAQCPAVAAYKLGHGYSMQQGVRFLSTNNKPWTKFDSTVVNGGKDKVQEAIPATSGRRFSIALWAKWILGSILSLLLPFWNQNWGKLKRIEGEAEILMEEAEKVAEVVEKVANVAEKVSEVVEDALPGNGKLKETVLLVERVSKVAAQDAQLTTDFIHKVEKLKQDLGDLEAVAEPVADKISKRVT